MNDQPHFHNTQYEAVIFNRFEHEGETKWKRFKIGNLVAKDDGGFDLHVTCPRSLFQRL